MNTNMDPDPDCDFLRMVYDEPPEVLFGSNSHDSFLQGTLLPQPEDADMDEQPFIETEDDQMLSDRLSEASSVASTLLPTQSVSDTSGTDQTTSFVPTTPARPEADPSAVTPTDGSCTVVSFSSFCSEAKRSQVLKSRQSSRNNRETSETSKQDESHAAKRGRQSSRGAVGSPALTASWDSSCASDSPLPAAPPLFSASDSFSDAVPGPSAFEFPEKDHGEKVLPLVVETCCEDLSSLLFKGASEETRGNSGHGDRLSLVKPATIQIPSDSRGTEWKRVALGAMISPKAVTNKVIVVQFFRKTGDDRWQLASSEAVGWVLPERIGDLKWLNYDTLLVASGARLLYLDYSTAAVLMSKRPRPKEKLACKREFSITAEKGVISEIEPTTDGSCVLVGDTAGTFSLVQDAQTSSFTFSSPVTSVRNVPESAWRACVSCTLMNGHICVFDRRARWTPVLNVAVRGDDKTDLFSHDWHDNKVVLGFSTGMFRTSVMNTVRKKPHMTMISESIKNDTVGGDIRAHKTRDEFVAFGPPNFSIGSVSDSSIWFSPVPPPGSSQVNVYGEYFDDDTIISASDEGIIRLWSIVNETS